MINSVQQGVAAKLDVKAIYELVGNKLVEIFASDWTAIDLNDTENNQVVPTYVVEQGRRLDVPNRPPLKGLAPYVFRTRKSLLLTGREELQKWYQRVDAFSAGSELEHTTSLMITPIFVGERVFGSLYVMRYDEAAPFAESDLRLLQTLAAALSTALENARLFDETQRLLKETEQRKNELSILNSVGEAIAKTLDARAVTRIVGDTLLGIFEAETVIIMLLNRQTNLIETWYEYDKNEGGYVDYRPPLPMGRGLVSKVLSSGQPLILGTIQDQFDQGAYVPPEISAKGRAPWSKSWLGVPITVGDQVLGLIVLADAKPRAFTIEHGRLLQTLSSNVGVTLENARLFEAEKQRAAELATINTVSSALATELDLSALIGLVGEQMRTVFDADIAYVALLDEDNGTINFPYTYGEARGTLPLGEGLTSKIIERRTPLLINQEFDRERQALGATVIGQRSLSYLGVPIMLGGRAVGVLSVQSTIREGVFTRGAPAPADDHRLQRGHRAAERAPVRRGAPGAPGCRTGQPRQERLPGQYEP